MKSFRILWALFWVFSTGLCYSDEKKEETPLSLPGSEPFVFRKVGDTELILHVVKPSGWSKDDKRVCVVCFFAGGWASGTPQRIMAWTKWAADQGFVGIAPDYRTRGRHKTNPTESVSDARAAVRWIQEHAAELGIDPLRTVALGESAGGHLACWTAITSASPGKDDPGPPEHSPIALILVYPVTDTTSTGYGGTKIFGSTAPVEVSVPDRMQAKMPPTLIFHGAKDETVKCANSVAFKDKMITQGNRCELITFEEMGHGYFANSKKYGEKGKDAVKTTREKVKEFLTSLNILTSN